jgi:uncharacterized protein
VFDSVAKEEDDLLDDLDALAGLVAITPTEPIKRSFQRRYSFPEQETKLRSGKKATIPNIEGSPVSVTIEAMDSSAHEITVKAGPKNLNLLKERLTLHPDWPLNTDVIASALQDVITDQCESRRFKAINDLLSRSRPRLGSEPSGNLLRGTDPVESTIAVINDMRETVLPVQGPPGTGKTYVSARAILSLVNQGYRVGITSNSHEAISNVLAGCLVAQEESNSDDQLEDIKFVHKVGSIDANARGSSKIHRTRSNTDPLLRSAHVVGATAWYFARRKMYRLLIGYLLMRPAKSA